MLSDSHFEKSFCSVEQMIAGKQDGVIQNEKGKGLVITNIGEIKTKSSCIPEIIFTKVAEK